MEARAGTSAATPASPTPLDLTLWCVVCQITHILYILQHNKTSEAGPAPADV